MFSQKFAESVKYGCYEKIGISIFCKIKNIVGYCNDILLEKDVDYYLCDIGDEKYNSIVNYIYFGNDINFHFYIINENSNKIKEGDIVTFEIDTVRDQDAIDKFLLILDDYKSHNLNALRCSTFNEFLLKVNNFKNIIL